MKTPAEARTSLSLVVGTDVQAYDAQLDDVAAVTPTADNFLAGDGVNLVMKTPAQARTSLSLVVGTDVQAYDAQLDDVAAVTPTADNFLAGNGANLVMKTPAQARTSLSLVVGTDVQAYDAQLDDIAALTPADSNFIVGDGANWVSETGATARASLGLGSMAIQNSTSVSITGGSITGITDLVVADGGTGVSSTTAYAPICGGTTGTGPLQSVASVGTAGQALISNGAGALPTFQNIPAATDVVDSTFRIQNFTDPTKEIAFDASAITTGFTRTVTMPDQAIDLTPTTGTFQGSDAGLTDIAGLAVTDGNIIVGDGANWVAESGATARASLGLTIGTNVQAYDAQLDDVAAVLPAADNFLAGDGVNLVMKTPAQARTSLGLGDIATQSSSSVSITGGSITGITDIAVADGGTGVSSTTAYAPICGGTTGTGPLQSVASVGTAGQALISNGAGALPTFQNIPAATDVSDNSFRIQNFTDPTKEIAFDASAITTATTHTITMPDQAIDLTPTTGTFQGSDAGLTDIAGLAVTDSNFIVGNGANWVAESGATARTSLGLTIGTDVQAHDIGLDDIAGLTPTNGNFIVGDGINWVAESGAIARGSLGLGDIATQNASSVSITGGSITGITDLALADGGTAASTAAGARTNLGLVIGTDVQAYDAQLDDVAAVTPTADNFLAGDGVNLVMKTPAQARTSLSLVVGTDVQAYDAGLTDIAGLAVTDGNIIVGNGANWVAESGATARASLGLTIGTDVQAYDAQLDDVAAVTPTADNFLAGNGANLVMKTPAQARTSLSLVVGTDVQAYDAQLDDIAALTPADSNFIVGDGVNWVAETGATARTSLGLGDLATQNASSISITGGSIDGTTIGATTPSTGAFTILDVDNLRLDANTILATDTNGNVNLQKDGTGWVHSIDSHVVGSSISTDNATINAINWKSAFTVASDANHLFDILAKKYAINASESSRFVAARARGTESAPTVVSSGDTLLLQQTAGHDGTDFAFCTEISHEVDGATGAGDMPGRIVFKTSADGSQTPTEAMRLTSAQKMTLVNPLEVTEGGVGVNTLTDGGILLGSGTAAVTATAQPTNGQILVGSTGVDPVLTSLTGGTNLTPTVGAGTLDVDLSADTKVLALRSWNGSFLETPAATVTSNGTTITFSIEKSGGGDLTMAFSDNFTILDTTPAATIALTAGTDTAPQINYIYIPQSTKVLTTSTSGFPAAEYIELGTALCQSAASLQTDGPYFFSSAYSHAVDTTNQGHIPDINCWIRKQAATYISGVLQTYTITTNAGSADNVILTTTAGVVNQLHGKTFPAFSGTPDLYIANHPTTPYQKVTDLNTQLVDAQNVSMENKYFSLVIWGVVSESTGDCKLMVNLPTSTYGGSAPLEQDLDKYTNYTIPQEFKGKGFLISRWSLRHQAIFSGTWTTVSTADLRGTTDATYAGTTVSAAQEFQDNAFRIFDNVDNTRKIAIEAGNLSVSTTRTITMPDQDVDLTPGTGTFLGVAGGSTLVTSGALNSGSITSGFGSINNGTSTLNTGAITATSINLGDSTVSNFVTRTFFTPTFTCLTPGTLSVTYNSRQGHYSRFGNTIFYRVFIDLATLSIGTGTGKALVTGLPFTASADTDVGAELGNINLDAGTASLSARVEGSQTRFRLVQSISGVQPLTIDISDCTADTRIRVSGFYYI